MPVKIACPKCSKTYTLPDAAVGKPVKCKACETTFRTKLPADAAFANQQPARPNARPGKSAQQKPGQQKARPAQPTSGSLGEFGIDDGFQKQADIFGAGPQGSASLDNFADQDALGEAAAPIVLGPAGASKAPTVNPFESVMTNSSMRDSAARKKARKKKRGKAGTTDVSAYGIVRPGMMCVFGAGATMLFSSFAFLILSVIAQLYTRGGGKVPEAFAAVLGIVILLLVALGGIASLALIVGQIMCMFAPNGNEKFNAIGSGALLLLSMIGGLIMLLVLGVAVTAMSDTRGPSAAGAASAGIGAIAVVLFVGTMVVVAMFMFVNFYRRVGQNIKSDALVKVSNQATIAICVPLLMPILGFGLMFILAAAGLDPKTTVFIAQAFYLLNSLITLVVAAVVLRMVWTGISDLKPA